MSAGVVTMITPRVMTTRAPATRASGAALRASNDWGMSVPLSGFRDSGSTSTGYRMLHPGPPLGGRETLGCGSTSLRLRKTAFIIAAMLMHPGAGLGARADAEVGRSAVRQT